MPLPRRRRRRNHNGDSVSPFKESAVNLNELMQEVRGLLRTREIKRLMPKSFKTEPIEQRRNPARAAKRAARKAA